jgi:hypothetical protein
MQRAALELIEYAAQCDKPNFTASMPTTFGPVTHLLGAPSTDFKVHWSALCLLKSFFLSGYHDEIVKLVATFVILYLQSPESNVQLTTVTQFTNTAPNISTP